MCSACSHYFKDSVVHGPIAVPHLVPLLMAMEGDDPVENSERGCQLLYNVLQTARHAALHAHDYQQHASSLLTGKHARLFSYKQLKTMDNHARALLYIIHDPNLLLFFFFVEFVLTGVPKQIRQSLQKLKDRLF